MDEVFSFELVFIETEGTVFTIIKDWLMVEGSPFVDMFSLPLTEDVESAVEGRSRTNPIVLEQTSAHDFRAFLCVFYPQGHTITTYTEWLGVLRLATRWNFTKIRDQAVCALQLMRELIDNPSLKIRLAGEFSVRHWLRDGLIRLIQQVMKDDIEPDALLSAPHNLDPEIATKVFFIAYKVKVAPTAAAKDGPYVFHCKKCRRRTEHYDRPYDEPEFFDSFSADTTVQVVNDPKPDLGIDHHVDRLFRNEMEQLVYTT